MEVDIPGELKALRKRVADLERELGSRETEASRRPSLPSVGSWNPGQMQSIIDAVPASVCYVDRSLYIRFANQAYAAWFNRPLEQCTDKAVVEIVGSSIFEQIEPYMKRALAGERVSFERFLQHSESHARKVRATYVPHRGEDNIVAGFTAFLEDLSEVQRAQSALKESEEQFRTLLFNLPDVVSRFGRDLKFRYISPAVEKVTGLRPEHFLGKTHGEAGISPELSGRFEETLQAIFATGETRTIEFAMLSPEGTLREYLGTGVPELGPDGATESVLTIVRDITDQKNAENAQRSMERQLMLLIQASGVLLASPDSGSVLETIIDLAQRFIAAEAYAVWRQKTNPDEWRVVAELGLSREYRRTSTEASRQWMEPSYTPIAIEDVRTAPLPQSRSAAYEAEGIRSLLAVPLKIHGEKSGSLVFYYRSPHSFTEEELRLAAAIGNLTAAALGIAETYDREKELRALAEMSERRAQFLSQAGKVLSSSLEYETTLSSVAKLAVPSFADWCSVDVVTPGGEIRRVTVEHADPSKVALAHEWSRRYPPREDDASRVALRTGEPLLIEEVSDQMLQSRARDEEHLDMLRQIGVSSIIVVPMLAHGKTVGVITFVAAESRRRYRTSDLVLAEELAGRAATAVDNARLYQDVRESEERFRCAIAEAPNPIMIHAEDGRILHLSNVWTTATGYGADVLHNVQICTGLLCGANAEHVRRLLGETYMGGARAAQNIEIDIRTKGGETRTWVLSNALLGRLPNGTRVQISSAMDITERKRMEAESRLLAAIVTSSQDAIIGKDLNGLVTSWNKGAQTLFGYTAEEVLGKPIRMIALPERADEMPRILERISRGEYIENFETVRRSKSGRRIPVSLTISPIRNASGVIIGASKIARDITDRKRAEDALRTANLSLQRINDNLRQFAYAAAHDLQEPLRMVALYTQLLAKEYKGQFDERADDFMKVTVESAKRVQALVKDLLTFTEAGDQFDRPVEDVDCNTVLDSALRNLAFAIQESEALVTHEQLPTVTAHSMRMTQVLQNLISNAIKYRSAEPPRIHVTGAARQGEWLFSVRDNGIGIDRHYHERIFGVFKRLHKSEYPGTGIGLAICARVINQYGGNIWVESEPGRGSTFFFTLPMKPTPVL